MATFLPVQGGIKTEGGGPVQLIQVGDSGFEEGAGFLQGTNNYVLAVPESQTLTGSVQHVTSSEEVQQLQTLTGYETTNAPNHITQYKMTDKISPTTLDIVEEKNPQQKKRSRKQSLTKPTDSAPAIRTYTAAGGIVVSIEAKVSRQPVISVEEKAKQKRVRKVSGKVAVKQEVVQVCTEKAQVQPSGGSSRRKRKSPVRSTMSDILGEPEFVEMYYFEETDDEEEDSYAGNILHLMKERQRRRDMCSQFELLQSLLASGQVKIGRNALLKLTETEVTKLNKESKQLKTVKNKLRDKNRALRKSIGELLGVFTKIDYESEEDELERVGGYAGNSSSSVPDIDDDESVDWGSSVVSDEETHGDDFKKVKKESESETEDNIKVELPDSDEDNFENKEDCNANARRIKQEPKSDNEVEHSNRHTNSIQPDAYVRVKLEPGASAYEAQTAEDIDYDRHMRVIIQPRSPVRRALFSDSVSKKEDDHRTVCGNDSTTNNLKQSSQPVPLSLHTASVGQEDELASALLPTEHSEQISIHLDPALIKREDCNSNW